MRGSSQRTHVRHPKMLAMHGIFKEKERRFAPQRKRRLAHLGNFSVYKDTSNGALPQDTNLPQRLQGACCLAHPHGAGMQPICIMFQRSQKNSSIDLYAKRPAESIRRAHQLHHSSAKAESHKSTTRACESPR